MWVMAMPARCLSISPARWPTPRGPGEVKLSGCALFLAIATNSGNVVGGKRFVGGERRGRDDGAGARTVLDHHRLAAPPQRQEIGKDARHDVGRTAGRERNEEP